MSFVAAGNVLRLALDLQGTAEGLSLGDIATTFKVSRKTAERMRDAVEAGTSQLEVVESAGREKRWRLRSGALGRLTDATAEEIATLALAAKLAKAQGPSGMAESLLRLQQKLLASQREEARRRNEPDIAALIESDTLVSRPGPQPKIDATILETLRHAVKACRKVRIAYRYRDKKRHGEHVVNPHGFLVGHRHYLVAYREDAPGFRNYALGNVIHVELLKDGFARRKGFSLADYSARSFGVFQEEPFAVRWRFKPEAAADAREYLFHPKQTIEERPDGSLVVSFEAGGLKEMAWHLLTWGDLVEVEAPAELRRFWQLKSFDTAKSRLRPNEPLG